MDLSQLRPIVTPENIARERERAQAVAYLKDTDWYATRLLETGKEIPEDIKTARAAARETAS